MIWTSVKLHKSIGYLNAYTSPWEIFYRFGLCLAKLFLELVRLNWGIAAWILHLLKMFNGFKSKYFSISHSWNHWVMYVGCTNNWQLESYYNEIDLWNPFAESLIIDSLKTWSSIRGIFIYIFFFAHIHESDFKLFLQWWTWKMSTVMNSI